MSQSAEYKHPVGKVVCVPKDFAHVPESVLRRCDVCFGEVWCCPWNMLSTPVCLACFSKLKPDTVTIAVAPLDFYRALQAMNEETKGDS